VTTITIAVQYAITYAPAPITSRLDAVEAGVGQALRRSRLRLLATYPSETVGDVTAIDNPASNSYWWATAPFAETGPLRAVRIDAQAAGTGTLILAQIDGATLTPLHAWRSP
jgi:hypothetical protein